MQHLDNSFQGAKLPARPLTYHSKSEYALCCLFEKYIPNWKAIDGDTFQVPIGSGRTVDYRIGTTLLEYHPILIKRELRSEEALRLFRRMFADSDLQGRKQLVTLLVSELHAQYEHRRTQLVALSPHRGKCLIVCQNIAEVHAHILSRFNPAVPSEDDVKTEFFRLIKEAP